MIEIGCLDPEDMLRPGNVTSKKFNFPFLFVFARDSDFLSMRILICVFILFNTRPSSFLSESFEPLILPNSKVNFPEQHCTVNRQQRYRIHR